MGKEGKKRRYIGVSYDGIMINKRCSGDVMDV